MSLKSNTGMYLFSSSITVTVARESSLETPLIHKDYRIFTKIREFLSSHLSYHKFQRFANDNTFYTNHSRTKQTEIGWFSGMYKVLEGINVRK